MICRILEYFVACRDGKLLVDHESQLLGLYNGKRTVSAVAYAHAHILTRSKKRNASASMSKRADVGCDRDLRGQLDGVREVESKGKRSPGDAVGVVLRVELSEIAADVIRLG